MPHLKSIFIKLSPIFLALFLAACGGASTSGYQSPKKEVNTDLGSIIGNPVTKQGYKGYGSERKPSIKIIVTPHQKGFKVLFEPVSKHFICGGEYVIQGGKQLDISIDIAHDLKRFLQYPTHHKGYVVYGANTSCGTYQVTTQWAMFADRIGFNPSKPYSVQFGSRVQDEKGKGLVFEINPQ